MARRNMDRLITMLAAPKERSIPKIADTPAFTDKDYEYLYKCYVAEDIFRAIEADPSGGDGTVLACVRDLRCYFMLIEAEMMSRGAVPSGETVSMLVHDDFPKPRTPEDGGQHASLVPYEIADTKYFERNNVPTNLINLFWRPVGTGDHLRFVLEATVNSAKLPRCLQGVYTLSGGITWIINIDNVPEDAREYYPRLRNEKNRLELESLEAWQQPMYQWDEKSNKFILQQEFAGWMVEN